MHHFDEKLRKIGLKFGYLDKKNYTDQDHLVSVFDVQFTISYSEFFLTLFRSHWSWLRFWLNREKRISNILRNEPKLNQHLKNGLVTGNIQVPNPSNHFLRRHTL